MDKTIHDLISLFNELQHNENILIRFSKISPGYTPEYLDEIEDGFEIKYDEKLRNFFLQIGEVSLSWFVNKFKFSKSIPEEDLNYISGSIQILNPFDMIMGKSGTRWKDILWFENMDPVMKKEIRSFIPFDFSNSDLIIGFKQEQGKISSKMYLFDIEEGITAFNLSVNEYLDYLVKTKGFFYWQDFVNDKNSIEFDRFIKYMPMLFKNFNTEFFQ